MSDELRSLIEQQVEASTFSGAVLVERAGETLFRGAFGFADRRHGIENTPETRFGIASGTKTFTGTTVVSLIDEGILDYSTTARSLLKDDLPLIADDVTVEHLLAHRSGIGDYLDEEVLTDDTEYVLKVPPHELVETEDYLKVLDGYPTKFRAGERFSYSNGGYVVLALLAERAASVSFPELVQSRVCDRAGMTRTAFLRSDELPGDAAVGYLAHDSGRTNVFHLPVRGTGDGGIYTTIDDVHSFWRALHDGRVVPSSRVQEMTTPRSEVPEEGLRYGLGFWLHATGSTVYLRGGDAGVSFISGHDQQRQLTFTVVSNSDGGAARLTQVIEA
ncbi:MAG TPA: serine hydrolase domain-containing protein [Actinomycetota bacterium]|nr:serine hydrolase domain-containing protein [Actinomycetota bacterium]